MRSCRRSDSARAETTTIAVHRAPLIAAGKSAPKRPSAMSAPAAPTASERAESPVSQVSLGSAGRRPGVRVARGPGITPFQRSATLV